MRIGIDIDGVLTDVERFTIDYLSKYCVENNIHYQIDIEKSCYDAYKIFDITEEQEDNFWKEYIAYYATKEKARPFASEIIKKLKEEGIEIYIITARWLTNREDELGEQMRTMVKQWLKENDIIYDKLIFSTAKNERKVKEIQENKIDVMIEDNPNNIKELAEYIPILCYDTTYNRECKGNNIIRCFSWYDIYKKIKEMKK